MAFIVITGREYIITNLAQTLSQNKTYHYKTQNEALTRTPPKADPLRRYHRFIHLGYLSKSAARRSNTKMPNKSKASNSEVPNLGRNPSPISRLCDIGYVDRTGSWRRVVNILDTSSCKQLGLKALRLERPFKEYVAPDRHLYLTEPVVQLSGLGGGFQVFTTGKALARYPVRLNQSLIQSVINPEDRKEWQVGTNQAKQADRGVVISPMANSTTATFIVGPITFVKKMNLPNEVCYAWLNYNQARIRKAARKMLNMFPPDKTTTAMCLCLTEFFTETWRTTYIRTDSPASPVFVGFKKGNTETSGTWDVINVPKSTSVVTGGFASYPVASYSISKPQMDQAKEQDRTEWVVGSGGLPIAFPSRIRIYWPISCFKHIDKEDLEQMQPIPLPPSSKVEHQQLQ